MHALQLASDVVAATTRERSRLRRDIHDDLGPSLTGVRLGLQGLQDATHADDRQRAVQLISVLQAEMSSVIDQIRRILADLGPATVAENGLATAIRQRVSATVSTIPIDVRITDLPPLPPNLADTAYRIAMEALTNTLKHADATEAAIEAWTDNGQLQVRVVDNGKGLVDPQTHGVGLESMRERARLLGGEVTVDTDRSGTRVHFTAPLLVP